ncbi:MAG: hypothetical protein J7L16_09105 [Deltaproteobacteria bacterium]|nr:hypothetical protein [Deltaproteobacteria bacterium]
MRHEPQSEPFIGQVRFYPPGSAIIQKTAFSGFVWIRQMGAAVAAGTGRLLHLRGTAAAAHLQRRVSEQYGERETVSRAAQRIIRSFIDWGVLTGTKEKDIHCQGRICSINDPELISRLIEAYLHARSNDSTAIKDLLDSTSLFPFRLMHVPAEHLIFMSPRLGMLRHGLDDNLVMLRKDGLAAGNGGAK